MTLLSSAALAGAAAAALATLADDATFPSPSPAPVFNGALAEARGWSLVTLCMALPLSLSAMVLAMRGSLAGRLAWLGTLAYLAYTYLELAVSPPGNPVAQRGRSIWMAFGRGGDRSRRVRARPRVAGAARHCHGLPPFTQASGRLRCSGGHARQCGLLGAALTAMVANSAIVSGKSVLASAPFAFLPMIAAALAIAFYRRAHIPSRR
jgi:hypothetical protein